MIYQPQDYTCLFEWSQMMILSHLRETCCNWKKCVLEDWDKLNNNTAKRQLHDKCLCATMPHPLLERDNNMFITCYKQNPVDLNQASGRMQNSILDSFFS